MIKRVFIIHGWEATPQDNWFPWLKRELTKLGFKVKVPAMPNTNKPKLNQWLTHLKKVIGSLNENTYLIGHSLGVITILRYLESLPAKQKIGGTVLVAGFSTPIGYDELNNFFEKPLDCQKVKMHINKIVAINSDNDPCVPLGQGKILEEKLGAKLIIMKQAGHLNMSDGFGELPIVLEIFLKMVKAKKINLTFNF